MIPTVYTIYKKIIKAHNLDIHPEAASCLSAILAQSLPYFNLKLHFHQHNSISALLFHGLGELNRIIALRTAASYMLEPQERLRQNAMEIAVLKKRGMELTPVRQ